MGKNNREPRAAKAKNMARARAQHQQHGQRKRPTGTGAGPETDTGGERTSGGGPPRYLRWREQVASLGLPSVSSRPGWVSRWADEEGLDRVHALPGVARGSLPIWQPPRCCSPLLVQAQAAMAEAAGNAPPGTRTRSQVNRSAFLLAYTERIRDRLAEINDAVFAEVEAREGGAFLPVLRARSDDVDELLTDRFDDLVSQRVRRSYDAGGWAHARLAADQAQLMFGDLQDEAASR